MAATGSKAASHQKGSNTLNLEGSLILALKAFAVVVTASGLTRDRQLPSACTVRSLFTQLMLNLIWIFLTNTALPPKHQAKTAKLDVQVI